MRGPFVVGLILQALVLGALAAGRTKITSHREHSQSPGKVEESRWSAAATCLCQFVAPCEGLMPVMWSLAFLHPHSQALLSH